ncbi:hypothetical protein GCM10027037_01040 [Mucilaginibacter koreensis]
MAILDSINQLDQQPRYALMDAMKKKAEPHMIDSLKQIVKKNDAENLVKVTSLIDRYGWLGPQRVGMQGSQALFLVIQHAALPVQQKYLPLIKSAEQRGEILSSNVALLEDRINMRTGKKQIYGSQAFTDNKTGQTYLYPIADIKTLDERRKKMGLEPIKDYAKRLGIEWDAVAYEAILPQIEAIAAARKF